MSKVAKVQAKEDIKASIKEAVDEIGGFQSFINKGEVVLLKPNFNTADPPPASTDLGFLKAVVELVYECGAKIVMIGDSSTMSLNSRTVMEDKGVFELEKMARPPRVYVFDERSWIEKEIPGAQYLKKVSLTEYLDRTDKLILLPCLKTHSLAQFTGSLKLSIGCMEPTERTAVHQDLEQKIAELNTIIHPDLVIMDGRICFINQGPSHGEIKEPNIVLASKDRVAIDGEGVKIIQSYEGNSLAGIDPWELPQVKRALELRVGEKSD